MALDFRFICTFAAMKHLFFSLALLFLAAASAYAQPIVNLGADTTGCTYVVLDAGAHPGAAFLWGDGTTTRYDTAFATGTYTVTVTGAGGSGSDAIFVEIFAIPHAMPFIGNDTSSCGTDITLSLPGYSFYAWSNGSGLPYMQIAVTGTYSVVAQDSFGCYGVDTINVVVYPAPFNSLGIDGPVCGSIVLNAAGGTSRVWENGSNALTRNITTSGTYSVTVSDATTGCSKSDTITIAIITPFAITYGSPQTGCDSVVLNAGVAGMQYFWNNTLEKTQKITVKTSGTYNLYVADSSNACIVTQSAVITVLPAPHPNLGQDTTICGSSHTLNAGVANCNFTWSSISTNTQFLTVTIPGMYYVEAVATNGCRNRDTMYLFFAPALTINMPDTVSECDSVVLIPATNFPPAGFEWSTGSFDQIIAVKTSGTYIVRALNPAGCPATIDTVVAIIKPQAIPSFTFTNAFGAITCTNTSQHATSYLWNFGDGKSSTATNPVYAYNASGTYTVTLQATNECGSVNTNASATVVVTDVEESWSGTLRLYPTGAQNVYSLSLSHATAASIQLQLVDIQGRVLYNESLPRTQQGFATELNLSGMGTGLYFARLLSAQGQRVEKIVVE